MRKQVPSTHRYTNNIVCRFSAIYYLIRVLAFWLQTCLMSFSVCSIQSKLTRVINWIGFGVALKQISICTTLAGLSEGLNMAYCVDVGTKFKDPLSLSALIPSKVQSKPTFLDT